MQYLCIFAKLNSLLFKQQLQMRILYILPYIPYPLNSGGNQAVFNMIDAAIQKHEVSLLFRTNSIAEEMAIKDLESLWDKATFYVYNSKKDYSTSIENHVNLPNTFTCRFFDTVRRSMERKINRRIRKNAAKVLSGPAKQETDFIRENSCLNKQPLEYNKGFLEFIYEVSRKGFDIIQTEFYEHLPLVHYLPEDVYKVFVQHEIRFVRNSNELSLFQKPTVHDYYRLNMLKDLEIQMLSHYDKVVALTETDKKIMLKENPNLDIYVSPAVVTCSESADAEFKTAQELVFVGGGDHFPNADAIIWFCKEVHPILKDKGLDIKLNIVGKWGDAIQQIIREILPSVNFTGFVENLTSYLNGKISVVPIRIGSGMRMKILDSIHAASPIVTTSKGCEGLPFEHDTDCLIADTAKGFADSIESLLKENQKQHLFAECAKNKLSKIMSNQNLIEKRMKLYNVSKDWKI